MAADGAQVFAELDPKVQDLLRKLEADEVETLRYVATIPKDELRGIMKMFRDVRAVSRFLRWMILTAVALFIATVAIGENVVKVWGWLRGLH